MNDITYRPFIRDSALGDINIQIPNLEIPVYNRDRSTISSRRDKKSRTNSSRNYSS